MKLIICMYTRNGNRQLNKPNKKILEYLYSYIFISCGFIIVSEKTNSKNKEDRVLFSI